MNIVSSMEWLGKFNYEIILNKLADWTGNMKEVYKDKFESKSPRLTKD